MANMPRPLRLPTHLKYVLGGSLVVASAIGWAVSLHPPDVIASIPQFVVLWTVMMAAMMLPSVIPTVLLFASVAQSRTEFGFRPAPTAVFVAGYLGVWAAMGCGVSLLERVSGGIMNAWRPSLIGGALIAAGMYQLSRWKVRCLSHCRAPIHFFMGHWRDGLTGAVLMGMHHGLYCVGCCWGLMLALIALGMMNPAWMGVIALLIFAEKVARWGERLVLATGLALIFAGAGIAFGLIPYPQQMTGGM